MTLMRREHVGFVFQSFNLVPTLTAGENIVLPLTLAGRKPKPEWLQLLVTASASETDSAPPVGAVRRPAAAGGHGTGAGHPARARVRRRAHRQPRLQVGQRDAGAAAPPSTSSGRRW